jgi:outer membrane protein assembly factor BamB
MLGVVPVFVNAGAALLPAIVAGIASLLGLLLRPRELLRLCWQRPYVPVAVLAVGVGGYFGISHLLAAGEAATGDAPARGAAEARRQSADGGDWSAVALELIRRQERDWQRAWLAERDRRMELERRLAALERKLGAGGDETPSRDHTVSHDVPGAPDEPPATRPILFRHDAGRSGYAGGGSPRKLRPLWEYSEDFTMYLTSPLVAGGRVYGATCVLDPPGNFGAVFALDAATGEELWYTDRYTNHETGREREFNAFFSSPALSADGKHLVIGQGLHFDADCELLCFDAETGEVRWAVPTPLHIEGTPAIEGDLVVAGAGAIEGPDGKAKGDPGFVLAVRLSDGKQLWTYPVNDPESSPVLRDGVAYVGSGINGSAVYALRTETDEQLAAQGLERLLWKTPTPYPAVGPVTLAGDLVLIGCGNSNFVFVSPDPKGAVLALDAATGELRWKVELPHTVLGPIAVVDGKAIAGVLSGELVALDLRASGKALWRRTLPDGGMLKAGPAYTGSHVYAVTHDGYLYVLDAAEGEIVERHYINTPGKPGEMGLSISSPTVAGGRVYVGSETGGLRCLVGEEVRP